MGGFSGGIPMATVLLVEDDDQVRVLAESYLEEQAFLPKPYTVEQLLATLSVHFRISPQARRQPVSV
jgi:DNA-binding response OmpR family regulator